MGVVFEDLQDESPVGVADQIRKEGTGLDDDQRGGPQPVLHAPIERSQPASLLTSVGAQGELRVRPGDVSRRTATEKRRDRGE